MPSEAVVMSVPSGRIRVVALLALAGRVGAGVLLGAATAVVSLGFVVCGSLAYVLVATVPGARRAVTHRLTAVAAVLAAWETRRLAAWYPGRPAVPYVIGRRAFGYLAVRWLVGVLGGMVSALLVFGAIGATRVLWEWAGGVSTGAESFGPAEPGIVAYFLVLCAILLFLDLSGFTGVVAADRWLAARLLAPGTQKALERRVSELTASRAEVVTNAVKHAGASAVTVRVIGDADHVVVSVHDDGDGGADPTGGGLSGLAGRVAAYDGRFAVVSPVGGPTTLTAVLPCA